MIRTTRRPFVAACAAVVVAVLATRVAAVVDFHGILGTDQLGAYYPSLDGVNDITGEVQRIAIVDTGIQWDHPYLAGKVVAGVNYAAGATYGSESPADYKDQAGHGTFVAGLIASNQPGAMGIAPNVELVSVRVLASNGQGSLADVTNGLRWINEHAAELNITAVNLSLGTTNTYTSPATVPSYSVYNNLRSEMQNLADRDIVTVVASGNAGSTTGLSLPAIFDEGIAVGSSTAYDTIASYTNRNSYLDLLAPGDNVASLWMYGGTSSGSGTSYAAPLVAGAAVLVRDMLDVQAFTQASVAAADTEALVAGYASFQDRFVDLLQSTGAAVYDSATGLSFDRLDLLAAISALDPNGPPVPEPATAALLCIGVIVVTRRKRRKPSLES